MNAAPSSSQKSPSPPNPVVVIPARMASTRLPGKPLADIGGKPMVVRVMEQALAADIGPVVVAVAEPEIAEVVRAAGGTAIITDPALASGSDRVHGALEQFDPGKKHDCVINLQGDLPLIDPEVIKAVITPIGTTDADIATLASEITDAHEMSDPNVVKAVCGFAPGSNHAPALYFSRNPVPAGSGPLYHHIGIYAFTRPALDRFVKLAPGVLEMREKLEQLRALENAMRIWCVRVDTVPFGVDTPDDLERARSIIGQQKQQ